MIGGPQTEGPRPIVTAKRKRVTVKSSCLGFGAALALLWVGPETVNIIQLQGLCVPSTKILH